MDKINFHNNFPIETWTNIGNLLKLTLKNHSNPKALNHFEQGKWRSWSTEQVVEEVKDLALGLANLGIKKGDCVGIMAPPSPRWNIASMAIMMVGGIVVPLFPNLSEENFLFEVNQTEIKTIFVERPHSIPVLEKHRNKFKHVIEMAFIESDEQATPFDQLIQKGRDLDKKQPDHYTLLEKNLKEEALCTIIYTSATTGSPKGVMLTHKNLLNHLRDMPIECVHSSPVYLSILPLAHIFAYSFNLMVFAWGGSIYYTNDVKNFGAICKEIRPTLLAVVPRLLERVYAKMLAAVHQAPFPKKQIGTFAFDMAVHENKTTLEKILYPVVDKIVYSHLREALGGKVEFIVSGGAPLNPHLNRFFSNIGLPVYEGWGMTEACPITINRPNANKIGSVGIPLPTWEVKIGPEGEILVRGTGVMKGYFKIPDLSAKVLDKEGWFHTGDKGEMDSNGFLTILGRIKELYKTSTGEYVAPVPIEQEITKMSLIEMAMVIAEGRKFTSVLLFPNKEVLDNMKASHNASHISDEDFLNSELIHNLMDKHFENLNKHLNHWEKIHAYCFIPHPPSIEAGEMTPSMKLRREVIVKKYQHLIDAMYPEEAKI